MSITQSAPFRRIAVELETTPYQVVIGDGALSSIGNELLAAGVPAGRKILVVSNADVAGPYGERCLNSLRSSGFQVDLLVIDAGEEQKTPATVAPG